MFSVKLSVDESGEADCDFKTDPLFIEHLKQIGLEQINEFKTLVMDVISEALDDYIKIIKGEGNSVNGKIKND